MQCLIMIAANYQTIISEVSTVIICSSFLSPSGCQKLLFNFFKNSIMPMHIICFFTTILYMS